MKAIQVQQFGAPDVMQLKSVPAPVPGPGQVLIRVVAAGVNPVETYIRSGQYAALPALPHTPGSDLSGTVEALGEGVTGLARGDRVYTAGTLSGAYAELAVADQGQVHRLPDRVSFSQGAALGVPYGTACRALLQRAQAQPGDTVLVHGATGGVGLAAVQLAVAHGMRVIATGGTQAGREELMRQGAEHVLDHHADQHFEQIRDLAGEQGVDVILEMLANVNLGRDLPLLATGGRVVVIGNRGTVEINPRDLMARDAAVLGMIMPRTPPTDRRRVYAALQAGLSNGSLQPVIAQELPLAQAPRAHELVMQNGHVGKIVLLP